MPELNTSLDKARGKAMRFQSWELECASMDASTRSFVFFAAQTRCNSADEMHGLIESMCASSFGVAGIADGMTLLHSCQKKHK